MKKGPLIIYSDASKDVKQAARNLPGVDVCNVKRLNILQLAPGGNLGRFCIYTKDAFDQLDKVFGTYSGESEQKKGYTIPRAMMSCADLSRIINSDQVQAKLKDMKKPIVAHQKAKKNPLKNKALMKRLNPYSATAFKQRMDAEKARNAKRKDVIKQKRSKAGKKEKQGRNKEYYKLQGELKQSYKDAEDLIAEEERAGNY